MGVTYEIIPLWQAILSVFSIILRYVAHHLHKRASDLKRQNQDSCLSLEQMLQGKKRKTCARFFYETLVQLHCSLKSKKITLFVLFFLLDTCTWFLDCVNSMLNPPKQAAFIMLL
jgi:hypothetical protein